MMDRQATARIITGTMVAIAQQQTRPIKGGAAMTDRRNLYKPIRVKPEDAQTLQWLTPGNTIEYQIVTNLDWQLI